MLPATALGRSWGDDELEAWLRTARVSYSRPVDIADAVAEAIADDDIVAWFQGRSEYGPRALGKRSLLANPTRAENLERLNDILFMGRPAFGQDQSVVGLFKVGPDGVNAERVQVKLGRSSVNTIEILSGLKVGDQVILATTPNCGASPTGTSIAASVTAAPRSWWKRSMRA